MLEPSWLQFWSPKDVTEATCSWPLTTTIPGPPLSPSQVPLTLPLAYSTK